MSSKGDKFQKRWDIMFDKLEAYAEKHGDCLVPVRWKADPQLGKWVSRQRDGHNAKFLTPERRARLDSIGFVWRCKVGTDQEAGPPVPVSNSKNKKKRKSATSSARTATSNKSSTRTAPKRNSTTSSSSAATATTTIKTRSTTGSKMPALSTKRTTTAVAANKSRRSSVTCTNANTNNAKKSTTAPPPIKAKKTAAKPRRVTTATKKTSAMAKTTTDQGDEWASQFEKVVQYKLRNGHTRFPRPYTADPLLGAWVRAQCLQWQRKALSRQRRELLEALDLDFDHHLMRSSSTSTRMNAAAAAAAIPKKDDDVGNKEDETTAASETAEEEASTATTTEKEEQVITDSSNASDSTEEEETDDSETTEVEEDPMEEPAATTKTATTLAEGETGNGDKPKTTAMAKTPPVVVVGGEETAPSATPKATTPLGKRRVSSSSSTTSTRPAKKNKKAKTDGGNDTNAKQVVPNKPSLAKLLLPKKSTGTGNDDGTSKSSLPSLGRLAVPFLDADKSSSSPSTEEDAAMMMMLREAAMKNKLEKDWDVADQDDRDHLERNWQEQFSKLFRYQGGRSNNGMPVDSGLRAWLETQRDLWRNGFLSLHRQRKLQSIGFDFSKLTSERERGHPYSSMYISYGALATKVALQDAASVNTDDSVQEVVAAPSAAVEPAFAPPTSARTTEALPQTFGFHDLRVHAPPPSIVKSAAPLSVVTPTTPMATLVLAADLVSAEAALRKTPSAVPREDETYRHHACEQGSCGTEIGQQFVSMPLPVMGSVLPTSRHIPAVSPSPLSESEHSTSMMAPPKNRW